MSILKGCGSLEMNYFCHDFPPFFGPVTFSSKVVWGGGCVCVCFPICCRIRNWYCFAEKLLW